MQLKLKNPIIFFDLETTGVNVNSDRIVEICILKVSPDGSEESKTWVVNPERPIPMETTAIHGISDEDVKDKPTFREIAKTVAAMIEGCDLAGFNSNRFDVPLLAEEFLRVDVDIDMKKHKFLDVQTIFHKNEPRTLTAAYKFYCKEDLTNAHSAEADVRATYEVLKAQLDKYDNLENDVAFLSEFSSYNKSADYSGRIVFNKEDEEVFNFGKHKGKRVIDIFTNEPGYYSWMMNGDFPLYTKKVITEIKLRAFQS
jgi:DNA polymerase-3 subunit epsilon